MDQNGPKFKDKFTEFATESTNIEKAKIKDKSKLGSKSVSKNVVTSEGFASLLRKVLRRDV